MSRMLPLFCLEMVEHGPQLVRDVKAWWLDSWVYVTLRFARRVSWLSGLSRHIDRDANVLVMVLNDSCFAAFIVLLVRSFHIISKHSVTPPAYITSLEKQVGTLRQR